MNRIPINGNKQLVAGDIVELHFKSMGGVWLQAIQLELLEMRLAGRREFTILNWSKPARDTVFFTVKVKKTNPVITTCAAIAAVIIAASAGGWLVADKFYQIIEEGTEVIKTPGGQFTLVGMGGLAIVAAIGALMAILPKGK